MGMARVEEGTVRNRLGWSLLSISVVGLGLGGCQAYLTLPGQPVAIARIHAHVRDQAPVHVRGRIGDRVPFIGGQAYELTDATGSIWVLTDNTPLAPGETVSVRGVVRFESIPLAGTEYGEAYILQSPPQTVSE